MRFFVTGVGGQLGYDVMNNLLRRGHEGIGSDIAPAYSGLRDESPVATAQYVPLDITDASAVEEALSRAAPDVVVHCAAWTAVDMAEDEKNIGKVWDINVNGTRNIASACKSLGCKLIYISTDYVFSGAGSQPWQPDCKDYSPINVYGRSKLEGELAVAGTMEKYYIVRIAWAFGINGSNFIKTIVNLGHQRDTVRVVCDQIGTPTYTFDLARLLVDMGEREQYGYYHATNEGGYISWYEFAREILHQAGCKARAVAVTTEEYGRNRAPRPFNSRLDKGKLLEAGFEPLPAWQDALRRFLAEYEKHQ